MSVLDANGNQIKDKSYETVIRAMASHKQKIIQIQSAIDAIMQQNQHLGLYTEYLYKELARNFDELNAHLETDKFGIKTEEFPDWAEHRLEEMQEMAKEFFEKQNLTPSDIKVE